MRLTLRTTPRPRQRRFNFRPHLEALEAREVPAAQPLLFTLDQSLSALTISGFVTTSATGSTQFPIQQQGPGSLTSTYTGTINTTFDPNPSTGPARLQFVQSGTTLDATVTGNWQPAVGGAAGSAPADYGARATIAVLFSEINADLAIRNLLASLSSVNYNLTGGPATFSFPSTQTLTITGGAADYRYSGLLSGQGTEDLTGNSAPNTSPTNGTLQDLGNGQYRLTTPIRATITEPIPAGSFTVTATITVQGTLVGNAFRPVVDLNGPAGGFDFTATAEAGPGTAAIPIAAGTATVTRAAPANLTGATVTLTNRPDGADESLAVAGTLPAGLSTAYNAATGVLQITGTASLAVYQDVLRAITYQHVGAPGTVETGNRVITVVFRDAQNESQARTSVINVTDNIQVWDNGDAGFSATAGFSSVSGQGFQNDIHSAAAGTGSETATWTFTNLTPGRYRVSATWTTGADRATNAPFEVFNGTAVNLLPLTTAFVNQELAPNNFTDFGVGWRDLGSGPFLITANSLTVRLTNNANEFVVADAIRIERLGDLPTAGGSFRIIDNGDPSFSATSGWTLLDNAQFGSFQGVQGDVHFVASQADLGGQLETATWTFTGLVAGQQYQISTTWFPDPNRATNAPYSISGVTTPGTVLVNQELTPNDFQDTGEGWRILGTYTVTSGGTITVTLTNAANEYVIADAVRIVRVGFTGRILDNDNDSDPAFTATSGWTYLDDTQFGSFQGVKGNVHFVNSQAALGGQLETAAWTFTGLESGQYRISTTWTSHPNRATNAPYSVYNGSALPANLLATVLINQEEAPNDFVEAGYLWEDLGTFSITSGTLVVQLTNAANDYVIADSIRIERVG